MQTVRGTIKDACQLVDTERRSVLLNQSLLGRLALTLRRASRVAAIGQAGPADIGDAQGDIAVCPHVLRAGLLAVRKRRLDQELCHEAERAGIEGALGRNDLRDGLQGVWLPGGNGTFSRANRVEPRG